MKTCSPKRKSLILLCVSLAVIIVFSAAASLVQTGGRKTDISRISFATENGTLSGLLYMPEGASADSPRPAVVVTHGYLNSAEMQDANAIELSRRGYVVLALDMYDHGHSNINEDKYMTAQLGSFLGCWMPFWNYSMYDAAAYMYDQPYVLKDEAGNGIIGVTGHSMGGFSSTMALARDEQNFAALGVRKIYCGLTEGSDFSYSGMLGVTAQASSDLGAGRTMGKVAAQYDEFFFNDPTAPAGTVRKKNYVATDDGKTWLGVENPEANTWYENADGGKRIIYQPAQTHPWNHFSKTTTKDAVEFYTEAFAPYSAGIKAIDGNKQVWQWKEIFEFIALIGFVMFIISLATYLMELPFFCKAKSDAVPAQNLTGKKKIIVPIVLVLLTLFMGALFSPVAGSDTASPWMTVLMIVGIAAALAGIYGIVRYIKGKSIPTLLAGIGAILAGTGMAVVSRKPLFSDGAKWVCPGVNPIAYWTVVCALVVFAALSVMYLFKLGASSPAGYGVSTRKATIPVSLLIAVITLAVSYGVLFLMDALFKVDFRLWVFAFKTFDGNILPAICKYLPAFALFYFASAMSLFVNTDRLHSVKGHLAAVALNAGDAILWLAVQYISLFAMGAAFFPGDALSGIMLVATAATLVMTAIITRAISKRSHNIWTAAFINSLLVTIMTIANTTVFFR